MDEFGVLVESIGFKAQGRSTPLADLKSKNNSTNGGHRNPRANSGLDSKRSSGSKSVHNSNSVNGSFDVDLEGVFQSFSKQKSHSYDDFGVFDDVFGGAGKPSKSSGGDGFDLDSVFKNSSAKSSGFMDDDIFGGMPGLKTSNVVKNGNGFGSIPPPPKQNAQVGDLLGNFGGMKLGSNKSNGLRKKPVEVKKSPQEFDGLIPGFGSSSPSRNGENAATSWSPLSSGSTSSLAEDPFVVLEQSPPHAFTSPSLFSKPVEQNASAGSVFSSVDEFDDFVTGKVQNGANKQSDYLHEGGFETSSHDLDSFFSGGTKPSSGKSSPVDPVFDSLFQSKAAPPEKVAPSSSSSSKKKVSASPDIFGDFSTMFGAPTSGEFQENDGESEDRRRARFNNHMKTKQRMAKALEEKNQRDLQAQRDQEEKHRVAEALDDTLKRWAAGKEGNLRALLSSLQHVLWPECGWKPVPLTDLITSVSVKKVYHKATLCVHPDKVQQKGANIQQKYIAEKVFDLLKEAWNKFNSEEL